MTSTLAPVLVYNRIDENRRNTVLLLPAFAVLVLPLAYGATQLLVPFSFYHTYVTMGAFGFAASVACRRTSGRSTGGACSVADRREPVPGRVDGTAGYIPRNAGADSILREWS